MSNGSYLELRFHNEFLKAESGTFDDKDYRIKMKSYFQKLFISNKYSGLSSSFTQLFYIVI